MLDKFLQSLSQQSMTGPVEGGTIVAPVYTTTSETPNAEGLLDAEKAKEPDPPPAPPEADMPAEEPGMAMPAGSDRTVGNGLSAFMVAASGVESGGNSKARNSRTGAYGTFQIMPANWSGWAREAGVDPSDKSALNQELVAAHRMQKYYDQFGDWGAVAVAWYAGPAAAAAWIKNRNSARFNRKQGKGNEPSINEYVNKILGRMAAVG